MVVAKLTPTSIIELRVILEGCVVYTSSEITKKIGYYLLIHQ